MTFPFIQTTDRLTGEGHPTYPDTLNAAVREFLTRSGFQADGADFAGFAPRLSSLGVRVLLEPLYNGDPTGVGDSRAALAAADVAGGACVAGGTYRVASNITLTKPLSWLPGAKLQPAAGVTVTVEGPAGGPDTEWIDTSLGGKVIFTKGQRLSPRWWGAKGDATDAGAGTDDAAAFQAMAAAIAAAGTAWNGHRIHASGRFRLTSGFTIPAHATTLEGDGRHATQFWFDPAADGQACIKFDKGGAAELFVGTLRGFAMLAPTTNTKQKIGIECVDTSEVHCDEVMVHNSFTSGPARITTAPSEGIRFRGREAFYSRGCSISADLPVHVMANPYHAYDFDVIEFTNLYAIVGDPNGPVCLVDPGIYAHNIRFTGRYVWGRGKDGVKFVNVPGQAVATRSITIEGCRSELQNWVKLTGGLAAGATGAVACEALTAAYPVGTVLEFGPRKSLTLTVAAAIGAVSVTGTAGGLALAAGDRTQGHLLRLETDPSQALEVAVRNCQLGFTQAIKLRGCNHVELVQVTQSGVTGREILDIDCCNEVWGRGVHIQQGNTTRFGLPTAVTATVNGAGAAVGAVSIPVAALAAAIPADTILVFINGTVRYARTTTQAAAGATAIEVEPLLEAIPAAHVATYEGMKKVYGMGPGTGSLAIEPDFYYVKATNTTATMRYFAPTGSGGLPSGSIWSDPAAGNALKMVP